MIKIVCVGKLKEKYLIDMVDDYKSRINKYHKLELIELNDTNIYDEEKHILEKLKNDYVILLDIKGKKVDSVNFANVINNLFLNGKSNIVFVIGSSEGVSENVRKRSDLQLSFSDLTFPHGLFRAVLLEQIYRSFKIINNEKYHK